MQFSEPISRVPSFADTSNSSAGTLSTNWKNSPRHIAAGMKFVIFAKDKNSSIYDNSTHRGQYA